VKNHIKVLWLATIIVALPFSQGFVQAQDPVLKNVYANYFIFGSILSSNTIQANKSLILKEFNSITPENELKPENVMVKSGSTDNDIKVSLNNAASILKFCEDNNISVRGHTLVWHNQTPDWFFKVGFSDNGAWADTATMNKRMESYIKNVFNAIKTQYPDLKLYAYDVVNEAFKNNGGGLRKESNEEGGNSKWYQIYGNDQFIQNAFKYARKYAPPTVKLYYNDYNEYVPEKTTDIVNLVTKIKQQGNIDGIGMQSHLDGRTGPNDAYPNISTYTNALKKFKETGLEIQITELDVTMNGNSNNDFVNQAKYYKDIMKSIIENGGDAVKAVVVWGVRDDQSWRGSQWPLLWTGSGDTFNKKPAYDTLVSLIPKSEWGDGSNPGVPAGNFRLVVRPSPSEGGTVTKSPDNSSYSPNSKVTISATASEGWGFVGWSGDVTESEASISVTMDANKNITAKFIPIADGTTNLVKDGDFPGTSLSDNWKWNTGEHYGNSSGNSIVSGGKVTLEIGNAGAEAYMPQLIQQGISLAQGTKYRLTFKASAGAARDIEVNFQQSADPWGTYADSTFNLTTTAQTFVFEFEMTKESDQNTQLSFNVGGSGTNGTKVIISDVELIYLAGDPTPILKTNPPLANNNSRITYYSIKGEPLGSVKPQKAGVYIVKQGYSIKKVVVR